MAEQERPGRPDPGDPGSEDWPERPDPVPPPADGAFSELMRELGAGELEQLDGDGDGAPDPAGG